MLKSPFGPHCMQCKDGCQANCGEEPQPYRKEISLRRLLPAVGHCVTRRDLCGRCSHDMFRLVSQIPFGLGRSQTPNGRGLR
jgi:hypothetical protein